MKQTVAASVTRNTKTGLLVSVRDVSEARIAVRASVDIIDIKEPNKGSLGAAEAQTINEILSVVNENTCVSVALGELHDALDSPQKFESIISALSDSNSIAFAKLGLSKMSDRPRWCEHWANTLSKLPRRIAPVAVIYADHSIAMAPAPEEIVLTAARLDCRAVLIDTYDKRGGNLFDHLEIRQLKLIQQLVSQHKMQFVLAGSVNLSSLDKICELQPDFVAVRGAVCSDAVRTNSISLDAINTFNEELNRMTSIRDLN